MEGSEEVLKRQRGQRVGLAHRKWREREKDKAERMTSRIHFIQLPFWGANTWYRKFPGFPDLEPKLQFHLSGTQIRLRYSKFRCVY